MIRAYNAMTAITCKQNLLNFMYIYQRFIKLLVIILVLSGSTILSTCGGPVPTETEIKKDIEEGRAAQTIRVANATRAGGGLRSSLSLYVRAHRMKPQWPEPLIQLGATHYALGDYEEASKAYQKATAVAPKNINALKGYGKTLLALKQPKDAAERYRAVIKIKKDDAASFSGLGVALDMQGLHEEAQKTYRAGIKSSKNSFALLNNLALSLAFSSQFDEAIKILKKIADDPAASARNRLNLSLIYGLLGDMENAAKAARRDLNKAQIDNNLTFYRRLKTMSSKEKAEAIFGRK